MLLLTYEVQKVASEFMNNFVLFKDLTTHARLQISYTKFRFLFIFGVYSYLCLSMQSVIFPSVHFLLISAAASLTFHQFTAHERAYM